MKVSTTNTRIVVPRKHLCTLVCVCVCVCVDEDGGLVGVASGMFPLDCFQLLQQ